MAKQTGSSASTATYWHTDHLGSTRLCTDSSGNSTGTCYGVYPEHGRRGRFGELQSGTTCPASVTYRYAGMEFDSETLRLRSGQAGFYHTWLCQYDASQGRWLSVDPLAGTADTPQSLNRYAYTLNNPLRFSDPTRPGVGEKVTAEVRPRVKGADTDKVKKVRARRVVAGFGGRKSKIGALGARGWGLSEGGVYPEGSRSESPAGGAAAVVAGRAGEGDGAGVGGRMSETRRKVGGIRPGWGEVNC